MEINFDQLKVHALFQGVISTQQILTKPKTKHPWVVGNQVCSNEVSRPFQETY